MMKVIIAFICILITFSFCHAQNTGRIISKEAKPKVGHENYYTYQPPKHLLMPDSIEALIIYLNRGRYYKKFIPAIKQDNEYLFSFKTPDSTSVIIIGMVEAKKNMAEYTGLLAAKKRIFDNNNNIGYIVYQYDKNDNRFAFEKIQLGELLQNYASSKLDIKVQNDTIIKMYEDVYKLYPEFTNEDSYLDYLTVLYNTKGDIVKNKLLLYSKKMEVIQNVEAKWLTALTIYELLKMENEQYEMENRVLAKFPNGELANQKFWSKFYSFDNYEDSTEEKILEGMDLYIKRFNDSSSDLKDKFYGKIVSLLLKKGELDKLQKYELLFNNKFILSNIYNKAASQLSGGETDISGSHLEIAKMLSKKALDYTEEYIKNLLPQYEYKDELMAERYNYMSTYALILYKFEKYDSAFYYQDIIYRQGNVLNARSLERYAVYAEKIKGVNYVKQLIEQQIQNGISSPEMLKKLQSIYKLLNISEVEFKKIVVKANLLSKQKRTEVIKGKFGTVKAKDFTLKNLSGHEISLSSFINKIVVIDFWATWCVPCRASFPAMQQIVDKYKNDNEVVFLFIDVWENKTLKKMQEAALKIMKENNYSFNVLLDFNNKIVKDYMVEGIPMKFVIDKKGKIVFMGDTVNIAAEIENAKN